MKSGSRWSHLALSVLVFVVVAVAAGAIFYFGPGSHHHGGSLTVAIVIGLVAGAGNYVKIRARRAGHDPAYNAGRRLRDVLDDQRGQGGRPLRPGEAPRVVETEPERRG